MRCAAACYQHPFSAPLVVLLTACGGSGGPHYRDEHPRIVRGPSAADVAAGLAASAPQFVRFQNVANAWLDGGEVSGFRGVDGAYWSRVMNDPAFCDKAIAQVDELVVAEEALIAVGEAPDVAHDSYLYVGEMVGDVMGTYDGCFGQLQDTQKARWAAYAGQAVFNVWNPDDAQWNGAPHTWSGWSINNPSNNYYYSFLQATMFYGLAAHGEAPDARGYLDFLHDEKLWNETANVLTAEVAGGGSREGTGYGAAMRRLFDLYAIWQQSTGERVADMTPHTRASLDYMVHAIVPTLDFVAPIGDHSRDSTGALFDYHRDYLQILAHLYPDAPTAQHARYLVSQSSVPAMSTAWMAIADLFYSSDSDSEPQSELSLAYFAVGTGHLFARSSWQKDATWFSMIGGPFTESHAHQDQGSFLLYRQGWLATDPNTFGSQGLEAGVDRHNLVYVTHSGSPVAMKHSDATATVGLRQGDGFVHQWVDATPAYRDSVVTRAERQAVFFDVGVVVVADWMTSAPDTEQVWQVSSPTDGSANGATAALGDMTVTRIAPATASLAVTGWAGESDFTSGFRVRGRVVGGDVRHLYVVSLAGAARDIVATSEAGHDGVAFTLSDGRAVRVTWSQAQDWQGAVVINGAATPLDRALHSF